MTSFKNQLVKILLGSVLTLIPLAVVYLFRIETTHPYFNYIIIFCNLVMAPFWVKYMFATPPGRTALSYGSFRWMFTGLTKYLIIPPFLLMIGFITFLGASAYSSGESIWNTFGLVVFMNYCVVQIVHKITISQSGRHVK